ncbi:hypothetical protein MJ904_05375 [Massilia sp. MB5]|uniref:hypothetical protein n=1 Tax=Massilia sp. MB5 TaxID=2919578 RepID=UPI001F0F831D|nr:hypothetical protein [Massilia sp. MB5]UMR31645.1 hypothetical protein MJ904_05375 [Massilia sp. MB5]
MIALNGLGIMGLEQLAPKQHRLNSWSASSSEQVAADDVCAHMSRVHKVEIPAA